jgi:hypothetical protein
MPKVILNRKKDWFIRNHLFEIHLDEHKIGYLSGEESKEFEVSAGEHKLSVKSGHFCSRHYKFNIYSKETKSFSVFRSKILSIIFTILILIIGISELLLVKAHLVRDGVIVIFLVFVSFIILYLKIRRHTYLIIKEEG